MGPNRANKHKKYKAGWGTTFSVLKMSRKNVTSMLKYEKYMLKSVKYMLKDRKSILNNYKYMLKDRKSILKNYKYMPKQSQTKPVISGVNLQINKNLLKNKNLL